MKNTKKINLFSLSLIFAACFQFPIFAMNETIDFSSDVATYNTIKNWVDNRIKLKQITDFLLALEASAYLNANFPLTALRIAIENNNPQIAQALINAGASVFEGWIEQLRDMGIDTNLIPKKQIIS